jgi:hypothetical protein
MNRHISHTIIDLDIYNKFKEKQNKSFFYLNDIKNSLKFYKLSNNGKKKILEERLFNFFDKLNNYNKKINIDKIIFIQNIYKNKLNNKKIESQGPGIIDKTKCVNHEDFYSFETIFDLNDIYFFSYKENNNIYFFDIRSFKKLLENDGLNPYNRNSINDSIITQFNNRYNYLKNKKVNLSFEDDINIKTLTKSQLLNQKALSIFQKIDIAGGINISWFLDLSLEQLKMYYKSLEDIWNYRAELSHNNKIEIVPTNNMFIKSVHEIFLVNNKEKIQNIILEEIEKLVSSSPLEVHRTTGGYYVLTALVEISLDCAQAMPWLIQSM